MAGSNKPNIPYIMKVLAELYSMQYGCEITITATLKEKKMLGGLCLLGIMALSACGSVEPTVREETEENSEEPKLAWERLA